MNTGRIVQVVGPVVDIEFSPKTMPAILNAIKIDGTTDPQNVVLLDVQAYYKKWCQQSQHAEND